MIVFGMRSLLILAFNLRDLGLADQLGEYNIQIRQRYLHLFWIPCFGLGKTWVLVKGNEHYELPAHYKPHILPLIKKPKTPWYTFAGPLLLVAFVIWGSISDLYRDHEYDQHERKAHAQHVENLEQRLKEINTNDIFSMTNIYNRYGKNTYLKVEKIKDDSIYFLRFSLDEEMPAAIASYYTTHREALDTLVLAKNDLKNGYVKDYDQYVRNKKGIAVYGDKRQYIINNITRYFQPIVEARLRETRSAEGYVAIQIINKGIPAKLLSVKNLEGGIKWTSTFPLEMPTMEFEFFEDDVYLEGVDYESGTPYKFVVTVEDTLFRRYRYMVEGTDFETKVKQL